MGFTLPTTLSMNHKYVCMLKYLTEYISKRNSGNKKIIVYLINCRVIKNILIKWLF